MKKFISTIISVLFLLLSGVQCTFFEERLKRSENSTYQLDLVGIQERGSIRAAVDNNSTSYYIYRGRRMGYEFELLRDLGKNLGVQVEFVIVSDIQEAFEKLDEGKVDVIAMNLEPSVDRSRKAAFTHYLGTMSTLVIGKKPIEKPVTWEEIGSDTIHVRKSTVYIKQLNSIKDSLGLDFTVMVSDVHEETLIDQVADGTIKWTVADRNIAKANQTYYPDLDASLKVSEDGTVHWAVRKNSPELLDAINTWLAEKKKRFIPEVYAKYFLSSRNSYYRINSPFSSLGGNRISVFDELIQQNARELGWDWRLLAALVYKESGFDTSAVSYAGAEGLLQLMPVTLERFGVTDPNDPTESLRGGVRYLQYLDKFWMERVPETAERVKFILASYNVGQGHVEDAWRLAMKYGKNTQSWKEVSYFLNLKSDPDYYRDPIVKSGYAKGHVAVNYVRDILALYDSYRSLISP